MSSIDVLRASTLKKIAENPIVITPERRALASDGFGGQVRTGSLVKQSPARVRLMRASGSVPQPSVTPAGLGSSESTYALTSHAAPLLDGDEFDACGYRWKVGPVSSLSYGGKLYGTEAQLERLGVTA